jgi:hypothetical protein
MNLKYKKTLSSYFVINNNKKLVAYEKFTYYLPRGNKKGFNFRRWGDINRWNRIFLNKQIGIHLEEKRE